MIHFDGQSYERTKRVLPAERAVAISVDGSTHAVMMASPDDLEDFAVGFLLTDAVIEGVSEIDRLEIIERDLGLELQIWLHSEAASQYQRRRRMMAGPVGCGLCGVESLELALPKLQSVQALELPAEFPWRAMEIMSEAQSSRKLSGAVHGAGLFSQSNEALVIREDIGRHNAMDKVIGHGLRTDIPLKDKVICVSSRVSLDLVIKSVRAGVGALIARATPSDLALHYSGVWGLRLYAPVFENEYFSNGEL